MTHSLNLDLLVRSRFGGFPDPHACVDGNSNYWGVNMDIPHEDKENSFRPGKAGGRPTPQTPRTYVQENSFPSKPRNIRRNMWGHWKIRLRQNESQKSIDLPRH